MSSSHVLRLEQCKRKCSRAIHIKLKVTRAAGQWSAPAPAPASATASSFSLFHLSLCHLSCHHVSHLCVLLSVTLLCSHLLCLGEAQLLDEDEDIFGTPWPTYSLQNMPKTQFTCRDKILGGYYADPETQCQMFHVCVKLPGVGVSVPAGLARDGTDNNNNNNSSNSNNNDNDNN